MSGGTTLPGKLASEISRVTALRCRYESLRSLPQCNPEPGIALMTRAIDAAIEAAGSPDIVEQIKAVQMLAEFTD